jgi:hypothetical protein
MTATASPPSLPAEPVLPAGPREPPGSCPRFPMLAITWRQHRGGLLLAVVAAGVTAAILVSTGLLLHRAHFFGGRADWTWETGGPAYPWRHFHDAAYPWRTWNSLMRAGWAIAGVSVGVPLVCREVEDGTAAFAWTQGMPKARWLLGKLLPAAGALGLAALAFGVVYAWWFSALARAGIYAWSGFALYPPALLGWVAAGVTIGAFAGALLGRHRRALAAGLAGYWGLSELVTRLRPHYLPLVAGAARPDELVISRHAGIVLYQPADRFWLFNVIELVLLLVVCGLLAAATRWLMGGGPLPQRLRRLSVRAWPDRGLPVLADAAPRLAGIRVSWRQHRTALTAVVALLAAGIAVLAVTGLRVHGQLAGPHDVGHPLRVFDWTQDLGATQTPVLNFVPFILGIGLGVPLVRGELQRRTAAFAWTQGMSRGRWLTGQLAGAALVLTAAAVAFGLVVWWWAAPLAGNGLAYGMFMAYPPALAGWTLLSLSVAVYFGVRARTAGGATRDAVLVLAGLAAVSYYFRGYLLPVATSVASAPRLMPSIPFSANLITYRTVTVHGQSLTEALYQPLSRFWALQFADCAVLLALALLAAAASIRAVRRADC